MATAIVAVFALNGALSGPNYRADQSPTSMPSASTQAAQVPISSAALWCPGPEQRGLAGATVSEPDQQVLLQAMAPPREALGATFGEPEVGQLTVTAGDESVAQTDQRAVAAEASIGAAAAAQLLATGGLAAGLSAAQLWLGDQEQRTGLALTACGPAVDSAWLLAGGEQAGRTERLVLVNPGRASISVEVAVYGGGDTGADVDGEGGTQIALEPGERKIVLLDALA
ncbi:MAG: DUF5719 family protein, partial [Ornithinimicrobium sp.]